jgi:hypothetical protein
VASDVSQPAAPFPAAKLRSKATWVLCGTKSQAKKNLRFHKAETGKTENSKRLFKSHQAFARQQNPCSKATWASRGAESQDKNLVQN